jgi:hypothetical protein
LSFDERVVVHHVATQVRAPAGLIGVVVRAGVGRGTRARVGRVQASHWSVTPEGVSSHRIKPHFGVVTGY